jgi:hypothetical protein
MNCNEYVNCPVNPNAPLLGYNAETSDVQEFSAMGFAPITPPPLNWSFGLISGFAIAQSTLSPEAAGQIAQAQAAGNAQATWTPTGGTPSLEEESLIDEPVWWSDIVPII